jgi:hypothetical protein
MLEEFHITSLQNIWSPFVSSKLSTLCSREGKESEILIVKLMSFTVSLKLADCWNVNLRCDGLDSITSWRPDEGLERARKLRFAWRWVRMHRTTFLCSLSNDIQEYSTSHPRKTFVWDFRILRYRLVAHSIYVTACCYVNTVCPRSPESQEIFKFRQSLTKHTQ